MPFSRRFCQPSTSFSEGAKPTSLTDLLRTIKKNHFAGLTGGGAARLKYVNNYCGELVTVHQF